MNEQDKYIEEMGQYDKENAPAYDEPLVGHYPTTKNLFGPFIYFEIKQCYCTEEIAARFDRSVDRVQKLCQRGTIRAIEKRDSHDKNELWRIPLEEVRRIHEIGFTAMVKQAKQSL